MCLSMLKCSKKCCWKIRRKASIWASFLHDDVTKWKYFPCYWPFVRVIHRSPVNSQHKGQWTGALMFSLICAWISGWVNNRETGDLRRHRAHYDVTVMSPISTGSTYIHDARLEKRSNAFVLNSRWDLAESYHTLSLNSLVQVMAW